MGTNSISNNLIENQCLSAATELLATALEIKNRHATRIGSNSLLQNPEIVRLLDKLDIWTNWMLRERRICPMCNGTHGQNYECEHHYSNSGQYDMEVV